MTITGTATITAASSLAFYLIRRGDYVKYTHADEIGPCRRTIAVAGSTVTVRNAHRWRFVEYIHARYEDWVKWPVQDWMQRRFGTRQ